MVAVLLPPEIYQAVSGTVLLGLTGAQCQEALGAKKEWQNYEGSWRD